MKTNTNKESVNTNDTRPLSNLNDGLFSNHSRLLQRPINSFQGLYGIESTFSDGKVVKSYPHFVVGDVDKIKVISYDDSDGLLQKNLIDEMGKRRVLISVKHHAMKPDLDPKERIKLQSTHAQLVIRSENKVCTYNNPQDYQNGMFGSDSYPMIFLEPVFPSGISSDEIIEYEKNIILWATLLNTFSVFPGDYNGGDPLSAKSEAEALEYGNQTLKALNGDNEAIEWIRTPSNHLYCAELVYLSLTLGLIYPLTKSNLSLENFEVLKSELSTKSFLDINRNPYIKNINLELPHEGLVALMDNGATDDVYFDSSLAVRPMLFSDMITSFIKYSINRAELGESSGKYQFELFQSVRPMINSMMPGFLNTEVETLIDELEMVLKMEHQDYQSFKVKLAPVMKSIDESVSKVSSSKNTFIPPHTFLIRSLEYEREGKTKGILGMKYFGHGVHKSLI